MYNIFFIAQEEHDHNYALITTVCTKVQFKHGFLLLCIYVMGVHGKSLLASGATTGIW